MFDPMYIFVSLVVGTIGSGFFLYGKRVSSGKHMGLGAAMVMVSYFVMNPPLLALLGVAMTGFGFTDTNTLLMKLSGEKPRGQIEDIR